MAHFRWNPVERQKALSSRRRLEEPLTFGKSSYESSQSGRQPQGQTVCAAAKICSAKNGEVSLNLLGDW